MQKQEGRHLGPTNIYLWMDKKQAERLAAPDVQNVLRYCNQIWYHEMPIVNTEARGSD